jgi:GT2 family glycosyltransferase
VDARWRYWRRERFPALPADAEVWSALAREPLVVPASDSPEVSVVIPVHGQLGATWACLDSIARTPAGASYELIVADDHSTDRTPEMLAKVRGIRLLVNPENLGFLRTVNRAARAARGTWIALLNNDTRVTSGWLGELKRSFDLFPEAGLVGAQLLFPDGRLQEAGGTVFRDGTASHYGRHKHPERPEYSFARRVDYCSAACVLIRRTLWEQLGGFDERYAPAYYEDTDLAFRVRQAGHEVIYQPACRVVHYEGISHGKPGTISKASSYRTANQARFLERWAEALREHPPARSRNWRAANRRQGPGLLVVKAGDREWQSIAEAAALAADAAGFRVGFWSAERSPGFHESESARELQRRGIEVLHPPYAAQWLELLSSSAAARFDALLLCGVNGGRGLLEQLRGRAAHLKVLLALASDDADAPPFQELLAGADALLVSSEETRAKLCARLPQARVYVDDPTSTDRGREVWQRIAVYLRNSR